MPGPFPDRFLPGDLITARRLNDVIDLAEAAHQSTLGEGYYGSAGTAVAPPDRTTILAEITSVGSPDAGEFVPHAWKEVYDPDPDTAGDLADKDYGGITGTADLLPLYEINNRTLVVGSRLPCWKGSGDYYLCCAPDASSFSDGPYYFTDTEVHFDGDTDVFYEDTTNVTYQDTSVVVYQNDVDITYKNDVVNNYEDTTVVNFKETTTVNFEDNSTVNYKEDTTVNFEDNTVINYDGPNVTVNYTDVTLNFDGPNVEINYIDVDINYGDVVVNYTDTDLFFDNTTNVYLDGPTINVREDTNITINDTKTLYFDGDGDVVFQVHVELCGWFSWCYSTVTAVTTDQGALPLPEKPVARVPINSPVTISGIARTGTQQRITLINVGTSTAVIPHDSASASTTQDRILTPDGNPINWKPGEPLDIWVDPVVDKWRVVTPPLDIDRLPAETSPLDAADDAIAVYDDSSETHKKVSPQTLFDTVDNLDDLGEEPNAADYLLVYDDSDSQAKKVAYSELSGGGGGSIDGSGTATHLAKWSDSDTLTDSAITDDGTTITVSRAIVVPAASYDLGFFGTTPVGRIGSPSDVSGTAGATYTSTEQNMLNDLVGRVNTLLAALRPSTGYGLIADPP